MQNRPSRQKWRWNNLNEINDVFSKVCVQCTLFNELHTHFHDIIFCVSFVIFLLSKYCNRTANFAAILRWYKYRTAWKKIRLLMPLPTLTKSLQWNNLLQRRLVKKGRYFPARLTVSVDPPPFTVGFLWFFLVPFWPYTMIICVPKRILHKKKSISMQLLESQIPPLTAAALRMIICKRPAPPHHHFQQAGPSGWPFARGRSSTSSFARGRSLRIIIFNRPVPPDDHLQEAGPSASSFARGRPLILTTTKRA